MQQIHQPSCALPPKRVWLDSSAALHIVGRSVLGLTCVLGLLLGSLSAQDQGMHKMPSVSKITSGPMEQAFSGKIETLDFKKHVLTVDALQGQSVEMFPMKNSVQVSDAGGKKIKVKALTPGTSIIVYYQLKGEQRKIRQIIVLSAGEKAGKKSKSHPS